jgi:hypothetical protein
MVDCWSLYVCRPKSRVSHASLMANTDFLVHGYATRQVLLFYLLYIYSLCIYNTITQ